MPAEISQPTEGPSAAAGIKAHQTAATHEAHNKAGGAAMMQVEASENAAEAVPGKMIKLAPKKSEGRKNAENREAQKQEAAEKTKKQAMLRKEEADDLSNGFSQREGNREYQLPASGLSRLADGLRLAEGGAGIITPDSEPEDLIKLVRIELSVGPRVDVSQVDKAFEFLLDYTRIKLDQSNGLQAVYLEKLYKNISSAKVRHYERFAADIQAAEGLKGVATVILGEHKSVADAMDYLREKVNNPRSAHEIFDDFMSRGLKFKDLKKEVQMSLKLKGAMTKQKQENPYLQLLLSQIKIEQAIFGVYAQSNKEFNSMYTYLDKEIQIFAK